MSATIIFKQSFKSRTAKGTAGGNVAHLEYIATRPGAVYNPGCGFGLWGKLPGDEAIQVQNDLSRAKAIVREASGRRTLYRAIISVNDETAREKGLYQRSPWENLVNSQISVIAKEMGIRQSDLCWVASMHRKRGHPHVHILYWDNGTEPRRESMPPKKFAMVSEHIRAAFARGLYQDEITLLQKGQRESGKELRSLLQSLCREANPASILDDDKVLRDARLGDIADRLRTLVDQCPKTGSLRYAYLPEDYKRLVDELVEQCLQLPDLKKAWSAHRDGILAISTLYGNGEKTQQYQLDKAEAALRRQLGNQVMQAVRDLKKQLWEEAPSTHPELEELAYKLVQAARPNNPIYAQLLQLMPPERVPFSVMRQNSQYQGLLGQLVQDLSQDVRFRIPVARYAKENPEGWKDAFMTLRRTLEHQLREDAGWSSEAAQTHSLNLLGGMLALVSQAARQRQAQGHVKPLPRSRDKSREQRADERAKRQLGSEWN